MNPWHTIDDTAIDDTGVLYFCACGLDFCIKLKPRFTIRVTQNLRAGLIYIGVYIDQLVGRTICVVKRIGIAFDFLRDDWVPATSRKIWTQWELAFVFGTAKASAYMMITTDISTSF